MALVLPRAISKLCDPTFGCAISGPRIHQSIDDEDADDSVSVALHRLERTTTGKAHIKSQTVLEKVHLSTMEEKTHKCCLECATRLWIGPRP